MVTHAVQENILPQVCHFQHKLQSNKKKQNAFMNMQLEDKTPIMMIIVTDVSDAETVIIVVSQTTNWSVILAIMNKK